MGGRGAKWAAQRQDGGGRLLEDRWGRTGERDEDSAQGQTPAPPSQTVTRKRADGP